MVKRLVECGHSVACYDTLPEARARMEDTGAQICNTFKDLAPCCDLILLSLPRAESVRQVMADLGPLLAPRTVILDTTTSEPDTTRALSQRAAQDGYVFLDGPVSGGPHGARHGTMTMVVGGDAKALTSIEPILQDLTAKIVHVGPSGSGHVAKIANNLLCAANLVLVSEMVRLAEWAGVSMQSLLSGINAGSGRSGVSEVNFPRWIADGAYDSGFTMGLMRKDVALATSMAEQMQLDLPLTRAVGEVWDRSRDMLPDSADFNEIYKFGTQTNV